MIGALIVGLGLALTGADGDWATDADGRSFRVGFDPGSRLVLGAGWLRDDGANLAHLEAAWLVRAEDRGASSTWKLSHTIGALAIDVGDGAARMSGVVYRGEYLRWSPQGGIVIPTLPPTRIELPLDVGFDLTLGELRTRPESDKFALEIAPVAADIVFDFWRSRHVGSSLTLAVGPRYDAWIDRSDKVLHTVAPFSRAQLTLHHEWCQGKQVLEVSAEGETAWASDDRWVDRAGASASYEWTFLALNDAPLSLRVAGEWRWDELLANEARDGHELRAIAGLRLGL